MIDPRAIVLFTLIPLLGGTLAVALHRRRGAQRVLGTLVLSANFLLALATLATVYRGADEVGGVLVSQMGNWPAPYGITVAVDVLAAVMLAVTAAVTLCVYLYALSQLSDRFEGG